MLFSQLLPTVATIQASTSHVYFPDKFVSWHMATSQWTIKFLVGQTLTLNWTS